jgi:hypothetical protein
MEVVQYHTGETSHQGSPRDKWWVVPEEKAYDEVFAVCRWVRENQNYRAVANLRYARLYSNMEILGLQAFNFARTNNIKNAMTNRVTYNVIKSCTDTAVAKIGKERPRPLFLTEKGNYAMQQKAKKLTQYIDGQFDHMQAYEKGRAVFRDACVFGSGAMKIYEDNYEVKVERVLTDELLVDDTEAMYGEPRQLYQIKNVDRSVLMQAFPEHKGLIASASNLDRSGYSSRIVSDMVTVVEAWHLPSSPESKDGKHVIAVDNCTLSHDDWEKDYFPFEFFYWHRNILGFWGVGVAEELVGLQLEINKILRNVQVAQSLAAVPRVWLEEHNRIAKGNINNQIGAVNLYRGQPPIFQTPTAMNAEIYNHIETLYHKAFEITGLSHMAATGEKPAGVDSSVGMRTLNDIASQRFADVQLNWEDFFVRLARQTVNCTKDIQDRLTKERAAGKEVPDTLQVRVQGSAFMESIKWKDVFIPDDAYVLRCFPTGILPSEPAGKLEKVMEMVEAGFYTQEEALSLIDFPDLEKVNSRKTSSQDIILKIIDQMLTKGRYIAPEPFMNLELARSLAQEAYMQAQVDNAPAERLELVINFMEDIEALLVPEVPMMEEMPETPEELPMASEPDIMSPDVLPGLPGMTEEPAAGMGPVPPAIGEVV